MEPVYYNPELVDFMSAEGGGSAAMQLPVTNRMLQTAKNWGLIPVTSSTWLTPAELQAQISAAGSGTLDQVTKWLSAHQTGVFLGAAALFVLALVSGGRRR